MCFAESENWIHMKQKNKIFCHENRHSPKLYQFFIVANCRARLFLFFFCISQDNLFFLQNMEINVTSTKYDGPSVIRGSYRLGKVGKIWSQKLNKNTHPINVLNYIDYWSVQYVIHFFNYWTTRERERERERERDVLMCTMIKVIWYLLEFLYYRNQW